MSVKNHSAETKKKISSSMRQYWEQRKNDEAMLEAAGFPVPKRKHSPETIKKMKEAAKGRKLSKQAKEALNNYQENKRLDSEMKRKLEKAQKGY